MSDERLDGAICEPKNDLHGKQMKNTSHFAALAALLGTTPIHAAPDVGLMLHDTGIGQRGSSVGATAGLQIQLGSDRVVKKSDRVKLGLTAGPVYLLPSPAAHDGARRRQASFVGIELKPGYSTSLNFAGKPVATDYTQLGAAEKEKDGDDDGKQSAGDKIAWVAAVAGGVMVAPFGAAIVHCSDSDSRCSD
jgi:hypothetical protein